MLSSIPPVCFLVLHPNKSCSQRLPRVQLCPRDSITAYKGFSQLSTKQHKAVNKLVRLWGRNQKQNHQAVIEQSLMTSGDHNMQLCSAVAQHISATGQGKGKGPGKPQKGGEGWGKVWDKQWTVSACVCAILFAVSGRS